jgi:hypothetical protein
MPEHGNNSNTRSRWHRYSVGVLQLGDAERGRTRQRWPTRQRHGGKREGEGESGLARGMKVEMASAGMGRAEGKTAHVGKSVFFFSFKPLISNGLQIKFKF